MNMFDYLSLASSLRVAPDVVGAFEQEAKEEFPNDLMLRELHITRALNAYSKDLHLAAK